MTTGSLTRSDLNFVNNVVQNTQHNIIKDILIGILRDEFSKDSYYHFVKDDWGFPKTPDLTGKPLEAGYQDDETTRIFIGEAYRFDVQFYPAIFVKTGSLRYVPISFNREKETVQYDVIKVVDGYGNSKLYTTPTHFIFAGAWEGQIAIEVLTRDILARDEIVAFCMLLFQDIKYEELLRAGIAVKGVSAGTPTESQDMQQEPLYKNTISIDVRSEWRRAIPVLNTIDAINFCVEFGYLDTTPERIAPNLTINTSVNLIDHIQNL